MPKTTLELLQQYCDTTNPVTRCSLRQCILDRLEHTGALAFLAPVLIELGAPEEKRW
jgi:hypothetical protein